MILLKVTALVFQIEMFMRTDVYALFALATRSPISGLPKGAVARTVLRRATLDDRQLLAGTSRREVNWAKLYLILYLPGWLWATWYLVEFGIPTIMRITDLSVGAITANGLLSGAGLSGAAALALCFGPLAGRYGGWATAPAGPAAAGVAENVVIAPVSALPDRHLDQVQHPVQPVGRQPGRQVRDQALHDEFEIAGHLVDLDIAAQGAGCALAAQPLPHGPAQLIELGLPGHPEPGIGAQPAGDLQLGPDPPRVRRGDHLAHHLHQTVLGDRLPHRRRVLLGDGEEQRVLVGEVVEDRAAGRGRSPPPAPAPSRPRSRVGRTGAGRRPGSAVGLHRPAVRDSTLAAPAPAQAEPARRLRSTYCMIPPLR